MTENALIKNADMVFDDIGGMSGRNFRLTLQLENKQLKQVLKNIVYRLDAEIEKGHFLYSARVIVDGKMYREIRKLIKNA